MSFEGVKADLAKYFKVGQPQTASDGRVAHVPGERARGSDWILVDGDGGPMLDYLSGEMGGGSKRIAVTPEEAAALASGELSADALLARYGAS